MNDEERTTAKKKTQKKPSTVTITTSTHSAASATQHYKMRDADLINNKIRVRKEKSHGRPTQKKWLLWLTVNNTDLWLFYRLC